MATELNVTQNLSKMTLDLPADTVTVQVVVKTLKGQYGVCQNNNHRETTFNPWSEDLQPTESFMRIVREMQIKPDHYYLETCMRQTLSENYGHNDHAPKIWVHAPLQDDNEDDLRIQSPCPSNWSNDLLEIDDNKVQNNKQTNQPANQFTNSIGTRVPQDVLAYTSTTLRQPQTVPQALQIQTQKTQKQHNQPRQKTRPPLQDLELEKGHKTRRTRMKMRTMREQKTEKVFCCL